MLRRQPPAWAGRCCLGAQPPGGRRLRVRQSRPQPSPGPGPTRCCCRRSPPTPGHEPQTRGGVTPRDGTRARRWAQSPSLPFERDFGAPPRSALGTCVPRDGEAWRIARRWKRTLVPGAKAEAGGASWGILGEVLSCHCCLCLTRPPCHSCSGPRCRRLCRTCKQERGTALKRGAAVQFLVASQKKFTFGAVAGPIRCASERDG